MNFDSYSNRRISFVGATRNRADLLKDRLATLPELVGPDDEVIMVDGASTDHTTEVLEGASDLIDIWISEPDLDATHAFNKGLLLATGRYIFLISDDDQLFKAGVEKAVEVLDAHPEVDLLICGGVKVGSNGEYASWLPNGTNYGSRISDPFNFGATGAGFVFRRSTLAKAGFFEPRLASDIEFAARAISRSVKVRFARIFLYRHSNVENSHISRNFSNHQRDGRDIARKYLGLAGYLRWRITSTARSKHTGIGKSVRFVSRILNGGLRIITRSANSPGQSFPVSELLDPCSRHWDGGFS